MNTDTKGRHREAKAIVCGAGIGGLTVAHELAKRGIDVTVYERNDQIGGLARSAYHEQDGHRYPVEYSWRVYGTNYYNLLRVLGEIPLRTDRKKSILDNLRNVSTYIFPRVGRPALVFSHEKGRDNHDPGLSLRDDLKILEKIFLFVTMSDARVNAYDGVTWKEFCKDLSPDARKYMVKLWGPVLGMDPTLMSVSVVARLLKVLLARYMRIESSVHLLTKPTNDGWFDEWAAHLKSTGHVHIKTRQTIEDFVVVDGKIDHAVVRDLETGVVSDERADYFVCGLGVEAMAKIVEKNAALSRDPSLKNTIRLAKICRQVQLSVQIFSDDTFSYPTSEPPILYLPDSPWALIIEQQEAVWERTYSTDPRVKSVLSVGICQTDAPGVVHGKPFTSCNAQEVEDEVIAQMVASYESSGIRMRDGSPFDKDHVVRFYIWDSFQFDAKKREMNTWEPKFSNNAGSLPFQPEVTTGVDNFLFATGYAKTHRFAYSMESAAEAGTRAANEIVRREGLSGPTRVFPFHWSLMILQPLARLDAFTFHLGLPHASRVTRSSLLLVGIYFVLIVALLAFVLRFLF